MKNTLVDDRDFSLKSSFRKSHLRNNIRIVLSNELFSLTNSSVQNCKVFFFFEIN